MKNSSELCELKYLQERLNRFRESRFCWNYGLTLEPSEATELNLLNSICSSFVRDVCVFITSCLPFIHVQVEGQSSGRFNVTYDDRVNGFANAPAFCLRAVEVGPNDLMAVADVNIDISSSSPLMMI